MDAWLGQEIAGELTTVQRYIVIRLLQAVGVLFFLSIIIFVVVRASGDPVTLMLPPEATEEEEAHVRHVLGLDRPIHIQYALFISRAVRGDFGKSLTARRPVTELIGQALPNSARLCAVAMGMAFLLALPFGVVSAVRKGTPVDTVIRAVAVLGQAMPQFWLGIVLMETFAVRLGVLPVVGMGGIRIHSGERMAIRN